VSQPTRRENISVTASRLFEDEVRALRRRLLDWYGGIRRPLPWRMNRDPYRVWISEIMLQQTTVKSVLPYYEAFLGAFPTVADLAGARVEQVLARWSGLGYYSRARNLHAAAIRIERDHGGHFPRDPGEARALAGVGPYTAAAVLSIAYDLPLAVLDGNVARVIARFRGIRGPIKSGAVRRLMEQVAGELLDPEAPGDFNQAMMELGALVCTPKAPLCTDCPLAGRCEALSQGLVDVLPETGAAPVRRRETWAVVLVEKRGRILIQKRPGDSGLMPGLWEFPNYQVSEDGSPADSGRLAEAALRREVNGPVRVTDYLGEARHAIMNRSLRLLVFRARVGPAGSVSGGDRAWVRPGETAEFATSSIVRKSLRTAGY
jgi:A/G-specific adenine glycosylase